MNNEWAFLPMRESNDLLGDPEALQARLEEDSYLYFRQVLAPEAVEEVRNDVLRVLARHGWVQGGWLTGKGIAVSKPVWEGLAGYAAVYDDVQRLETFHTLAHDEALNEVMRQVVGPTAFPHPLKIARLSYPSNPEISTPPHQDYPNNQGTERLLASWIPLGDIPTLLGGLAILRGSHRYGLLPLTTHPGPGARQAVLPPEMLEACRWVTTDFHAGDVLLFPAMAVHASLHNASEMYMRLSVDFRWQQEGEALTPGCLEPHFQRLSWEEVYEGWESTEHQYYWRELDYEVVPFEDLSPDLIPPDFSGDPSADLEEEVISRVREGTVSFTPEEWGEMVRMEQRQNLRWERRRALLAEVLGREPTDEELEHGIAEPVGAAESGDG